MGTDTSSPLGSRRTWSISQPTIAIALPLYLATISGGNGAGASGLHHTCEYSVVIGGVSTSKDSTPPGQSLYWAGSLPGVPPGVVG